MRCVLKEQDIFGSCSCWRLQQSEGGLGGEACVIQLVSTTSVGRVRTNTGNTPPTTKILGTHEALPVFFGKASCCCSRCISSGILLLSDNRAGFGNPYGA